MAQLAIIGAGAAGLAAARALRQRQPGLAATIYEQSRSLGGRLATRRRGGFIFDHGAQNVRAPTPALARLLAEELPAAQLHDIGLPVWVFGAAGVPAPGDPAQNAEPKWIYRDGLSRLAKLLAKGTDIRRGVEVTRIEDRQAVDSSQPRFALFGPNGTALGTADAVLLTPPAPQAAQILAASALSERAGQALLAELGRATYRPCISLALAFPRPLARPYYALVNTDRAHPIAWLALEHTKAPERCPPGHSLIMAQMAPAWSQAHWQTAPAALAQQIAPLACALLGEQLGAPLWGDAWRWRYALPDAGADFELLNGTGSGVFFAGDYTAGLGRVHLAIESGWRAAEAIERWLGAAGLFSAP